MYEVMCVKDKGLDSIVTVKVTKQHNSVVDGVEVPPLDKGTAYHESLHTNRVIHSHREDTLESTVLVLNPVTDAKIREQIQPLLDCDCFDIGEDDTVRLDIEEVYLEGDRSKTSYARGKCPQEILDILTAKFPDEDHSDFTLLSTAIYHTVLGENIITGFKHTHNFPHQRCDEGIILCISRKFCLESNNIFDKRYLICDPKHHLLPDECTALSQSVNKVYDASFIIPDFYDLYFTGDSDYVEAAFDLPHRVGKHSTYYGATVVNDEIVRVKQYCYDQANTFSNWDDGIRMAVEGMDSSTVFQHID